MDKNEVILLETINLVLTWMFVAEMLIKIIGLGLKSYAKEKFNLFDCFIVIVSIIELILSSYMNY